MRGGPASGLENVRPGPGERGGLRCARPQWSLWAPAEPAGSPVVSEEQFDLLSALNLRQEMQSQRVFKSFLSMGQARPDPL